MLINNYYYNILGHKNVVLLLLDAKSNIDHQTKTGCTPLMEATRFNFLFILGTFFNPGLNQCK